MLYFIHGKFWGMNRNITDGSLLVERNTGETTRRFYLYEKI